MMSKFLTAAVLAMSLVAGTAQAREPGSPAAMPGGATVGVPVGANPPPGLYFSSRTELFYGDIYSGTGTKLPLSLDVKASVLQFHWVPGNQILGGSYRAMMLLPLVDVNLGGVSNSGIGDLTLSPLNLSWMLSPGVFVHSGLSFGIPTGQYLGLGKANLGNNVLTTGVDVGFSYLKDGWNASIHANYFTYATNKADSFKSGSEILVNMTAMKAIANDQSIGLVGYYRKQLTNDKLAGAVFGAGNKSQILALGLGYSKRFGPSELNINALHDVSVKNDAGGSKIQINFTTPIKF